MIISPKLFNKKIIHRCVVSGAGKIALHVVEKLIVYGAVPITISGIFIKHDI